MGSSLLDLHLPAEVFWVICEPWTVGVEEPMSGDSGLLGAVDPEGPLAGLKG